MPQVAFRSLNRWFQPCSFAGLFSLAASAGLLNFYAAGSLRAAEPVAGKAPAKAAVATPAKPKAANAKNVPAKDADEKSAGIAPGRLPGIVLDDSKAKFTGEWRSNSTASSPFVGKGYSVLKPGEKGSARFEVDVPDGNPRVVLVAYTAGTNRASDITVTVTAGDGEHKITLDQQKKPNGPYCFHSIGTFQFDPTLKGVIELSADGSKQNTLVDAVMLIPPEDLALFVEDAKKTTIAKLNGKNVKPEDMAGDKPATPPPPAEPFHREKPKRPLEKITSSKLDQLLEKETGPADSMKLASDEIFLRRVAFDITGRQPTPAMIAEFVADKSPNKNAAWIDRLLASPQYGENWANYWVDVIGSRQMEPELTFHNYTPMRTWLAEQLNTNKGWDDITYQMLSSEGKVAERPAVTYVAFHQADPSKLAGETSRIFLGTQIACAECHDHPFVEMKQGVFHGMAAFFARTQAKIAQNDSGKIEVVAKKAGEHKIPGIKGEMAPTMITGQKLELGTDDGPRRAAIARGTVSGDNPLFAKAYVNRLWRRLMGRGFCEPVDDMGSMSHHLLPQVHTALADHFTATEFDTKDVLRVILNSRAYQRDIADPSPQGDKPFDAARAKKLRGDEVYDALALAIGLPNVTPPADKPTKAIRFPPPPKSTRDLVVEAYGYDPSMNQDMITRTLKQAMFMMNNEQVQKQLVAKAGADTLLAKLLTEEKDDSAAFAKLFQQVLARKPNERETAIAVKYIAASKDRATAFEDLAWSLINSAEFVTGR